jgi:hypothetical protein
MTWGAEELSIVNDKNGSHRESQSVGEENL